MSMPRYPEYKNIGVEWLGEVPGHWEIRPFYSVASEREEPNVGMQEDNLLSLSYGRIVQKDITSNDGLLPESFETYQVIRPGDMVFRLTDLQNDKRSLRTALVEEKGIITSAYVAAKPTNIEPRYLSQLLRAYDVTKVFYSMGGGLRQSMKFSDLKRLPTLLPPSDEQQTIAAFLDRETGKIDALIAEQRRLVELLAEKRQAVISHAVTKGLGTRHSGAGRNPAEKTNPQSGQNGGPAAQEFSNELDSGLRRNDGVVMKDSGIEWLGDVPEHWEVKRLKRSLQLLTEKTNRRDNPIALENIQGWSGRFIPTETEFEGEGVAFERGDILFGKLRPYLAKVYLTESSGEAVGDFHVMRPAPKIDGRFIVYQMLSRNFITIVDSSTFGAKMPRVAWDFMSNMMLAIPPKAEQQTIASFLDTETAKFDTLTAEANRAIALLQERRSALISAAVTGKIDVRTLSPMQEA